MRKHAVLAATATGAGVVAKAGFCQHWAGVSTNDRQFKLFHQLLDGFDGRLTSDKWSAIGKCSPDTALRDIPDLVERGALPKSQARGRRANNVLIPADALN